VHGREGEQIVVLHFNKELGRNLHFGVGVGVVRPPPLTPAATTSTATPTTESSIAVGTTTATATTQPHQNTDGGEKEPPRSCRRRLRTEAFTGVRTTRRYLAMVGTTHTNFFEH
jgi:hypothetical protein